MKHLWQRSKSLPAIEWSGGLRLSGFLPAHLVCHGCGSDLESGC